MFCSNCGAEIGEKDVNCPYCGVMNPRAAEKKYMDKLEGILEDTEKLREMPAQQTKGGMRKAGRMAVFIFCIVALVAGGLAVAMRVMEESYGYGDSSVRAEAEFKQTYFPKLDELYAAGDDDATADYLSTLYDVKGSSVLRIWDHYKYMVYYMDFMALAALRENAEEQFDTSELENMLYCGLDLIYQLDTSSNHPMTDEEKEKVAGFKEEARQILWEYLSMDEAALEEAYQAGMTEGGYLSFIQLSEWFEEWRGEMG